MEKEENWTVEFEKDGIIYKAKKGSMTATKDGEQIFLALDVFPVKPTPEDMLFLYGLIMNTSD